MDDPRTPPRHDGGVVHTESAAARDVVDPRPAETARVAPVTDVPRAVIEPDPYRGAPLERRPLADRVRWGPLWAGLVVTLAVFILLQLTFFATDVISIDINPTDSSNAVPFWTAIAAIAAFLLGGVVASATSPWKQAADGILQGVVLWALAVVALVLLSVFGAGIVTSSLGGLSDQLDFIQESLSNLNGQNIDQGQAVSDARDTAASAVLLLGITIAASVVGAVIGSKLWPRREWYPDDDRLARPTRVG
jgi:hypothetical protein